MVQTLGTHITSFDAQPPTSVNARLHGGVVKVVKDAIEVPDTANADSIIMFRFPIDAVIHRVYFANDALGAGTVDIGLWKKNNDGTYTAVDADCFASAIAVTGANAIADVTCEAAATDISKLVQPAWQRAGLTTRPSYGDIYLGLSTPTGTSTVATAYVEVAYTE